MFLTNKKHRLALILSAVPAGILMVLSSCMDNVTLPFAIGITLISLSVISLIHPLVTAWIVGCDFLIMLRVLITGAAFYIVCDMYGPTKSFLNVCWFVWLARVLGNRFYMLTRKDGDNQHDGIRQ